MEDKVKELVERRAIALFKHEQQSYIDEENRRPPELRMGELHIAKWDKLDEESRCYWRTKARIALSDSDLALIDRLTYQPRKCTTCKYHHWRFDHLHCGYPGQEKYPGSNDARRGDCPIPRLKILPVIPLAEAIKEE